MNDAPAGASDRGRRRRLLETFTGVPATEGNEITLLRNGGEIFPAMLEAIGEAHRTIDFLTFVYWGGEIAQQFADALAQQARAGVRVRVLLDGFGAHPMDPAQRDQMREAGVQLVEFRPLTSWRVWRTTMRTHRRVLVCDETVAFTGGVGIAQEWLDGVGGDVPGWRSTHFRIVGPAVAGIQAAFLADWLEGDHPLLGGEDQFPAHARAGSVSVQVVRATSQADWNQMAIVFEGMLELAEEHVRISSAYFRPPRHFRDALVRAARRGVRVDVLVPGPHAIPAAFRWAGEYHYEGLLAGGVNIWHYQPTMYHAKMMTVDGRLALIGTANYDARSITLNEQVGLVVHDPDVTAVLELDFEEDLRESRRIRRASWVDRGTGRRTREFAAHTLTYLLGGAALGPGT